MEYTLLICVIIFMAAMGAYGYMKGILSMLISVVALAATIIITTVLTIPVSVVVEKSAIGDEIYDSVFDIVKEAKVVDIETIDNLHYPDVILEPISEGARNATIAVEEYVTDALTKTIIKSGVFLILSIVVFVVIKIVVAVLNLASKLPVISDINKLAGALVGLAMGVVILWLCCLIISAFSNEPWAQNIFKQINENEVLSFIYNNNLITWLVSDKL